MLVLGDVSPQRPGLEGIFHTLSLGEAGWGGERAGSAAWRMFGGMVEGGGVQMKLYTPEERFPGVREMICSSSFQVSGVSAHFFLIF